MKKAAFVIFCYLTAGTAFAQVTMTGGKGTLRLYEADNITPGHLYVNPFGTFFATKMADINVLAKDYTVNVGLTFGISRVFETFIHIVPFQTDQIHIWGPPGDSKVGVKLHVPNRGGVAHFGLAAFASFPTARVHPIPYEPYSEKAIGYALLGLASFNFKNAASQIPVKVTANVGYRNHNASQGFGGRTDQLIGGIGFKFPVKASQLYSEVTGEIFINNDEVQLHQNSIRFTQGYKFITRNGLIFDIAADIRLGGCQPTETEKKQTPRFYEDYADWKIILGMTWRMTLLKKWDDKFQQVEQRRRLRQNDQEEIRKKREKVVNELEEYKKRLEGEKKQEVPF